MQIRSYKPSTAALLVSSCAGRSGRSSTWLQRIPGGWKFPHLWALRFFALPPQHDSGLQVCSEVHCVTCPGLKFEMPGDNDTFTETQLYIIYVVCAGTWCRMSQVIEDRFSEETYLVAVLWQYVDASLFSRLSPRASLSTAAKGRDYSKRPYGSHNFGMPQAGIRCVAWEPSKELPWLKNANRVLFK